MEPEQLPEFVHDLAEWTRTSAAVMWCNKFAQGSPFYWPPGVTAPDESLKTRSRDIYERVVRAGGSHELAQSEMFEVQRRFTARSFKELADYHATTLERAELLYVGRDVSYLAAQAIMKEFRLDLDLFRRDAGQGSLMPCGFVMWDTPIGEAEPRGTLKAEYDLETGELLDVDIRHDMMEGFRESETPVNAASWRILPNMQDVLVTFYTDGTKARAMYERYVESQRIGLPPGMTIDESAVRLQLSDPQPLEREQVLPLNRTLAWFEEKDAAERLMPTMISDPAILREAERAHVEQDYAETNERVLPMLSQMVKTFVATLAVRRMKLIRQEEVAPPRQAVKRMRRGGAAAERQEGRVRVLRIGAPIKRRPKGESSGGGKWKVKTVVGPVIRTRQYVPALDEYRNGTWVIEPYVAGPEDAPWSKNAKVFLLE